MFDDLLGAAHMRSDFRYRLDDEMQIADRHPLGKQQLQHRLQARIGDVRCTDFLGELPVFRVETLDQGLHVLVGQKLGQIVADHFAQMRQQHRHVVGEGELVALQVLGEHVGDRIGAHAESRLLDLFAGHVGRTLGAHEHHQFADPHLVFRNDGPVDLDLVALGRNGKIVGKPHFGNHEAVLRGKLLAHLAHAKGEFLVRRQQPGRQLLADQEFDFGRLQRRFDGFLLGVFLGGLDLPFGFFGVGPFAVGALGQNVSDAHHDARQTEKGQGGQAGNDGQQRQQSGGHEQSARIGAQLAEDGLVGRTARSALGDQKTCGKRNDEGGDLRHQTVAHRQLGEDVRGLAQIHAMTRIADGNAADDVDGGDDEAGDGVAAHEFGCTVHGAEESALFLQFPPAELSFLFIYDAGRQIGIDRHLLAWYGVEGEAGAHFGNTRRALGDDDEVDHDQDQEHDQADDEITAHDQLGKTANDVARRVRAFIAVRQDHARGGDVERQPEHRGDEQDGREGREVERPLDPQRDHEDQHRNGDGKRQPDVDDEGGNRQKQDRQDGDDAEREAHVPAMLSYRPYRSDAFGCRHACFRLPDRVRFTQRRDPATPNLAAQACVKMWSAGSTRVRLDLLRARTRSVSAGR